MSYRRGADFESWLVDYFRAAGWMATRTAGSHGEADVWAARARWAAAPRGAGVESTKRTALVLVQAKSGASSLPGTEEWNALWAAGLRTGAVPVLAHRVRKGSPKVDWWELTGPKVKPGQARKNWPWRLWTPPEPE